MVVNYTVQPSVVSSGTYDVTITSSAHHRSLVFFLQAVQITQSTLVSLEASPANDLETVALPASAHPQGLLKGVAGTACASHTTSTEHADFGSPSWSMADAQDTLSELHELVVRVPAPWGSSGAAVRVANVLLPY